MLIIAHRAKNHEYAENTLEAIKYCNSLKVDMIEIDIRVTKDGVAILHHDKYLQKDRDKYIIKNTNFNDLKLIDNKLTKLQDALNLTRVKLLIEIKPGVVTEPIFNILKNSKNHNIVLTSFDFSILKRIKQELPEISLAVLDKWSGVRATSRAKKLETKVLIMNQKWLWSGFIKSIANSDYQLYAYTINNPKKAKNWKVHGLKAVITDNPKIFN